MSTTVDVRVVEMKFNNKDFESNVKTSLSTLDKLKEKSELKGASKGMEDLGKAAKSLDFSDLNQNVEALAQRFSALGEIGAHVLHKVTDAALGAGKKIAGTVFDSIVQGGIKRATNIEQAKFQLEGLGVAWKDIEDDINYGVQDTAYGLDVAATAASQLVASGVEVGDSMKRALRGISGTAAMTNSTFEEISPIFTTIAGQGKIMTQQLRMLEGRGLNAAATLANFFNGVNNGSIEATQSVADFIDYLTDGQEIDEGIMRDFISDKNILIGFDVFAEAMDSTFGQHAKDANKTFTGAMANMKSALARIGADFVQPMIAMDHGGENLIAVFNALRLKFNEVRKATSPIAKTFTKFAYSVIPGFVESINNLSTNGIKRFGIEINNLWALLNYMPIKYNFLNAFSNFSAGFSNIGRSIFTLLKSITSAFAEVFNTRWLSETIKSISEIFLKLTDALGITDSQAGAFKETFGAVFEVIRDVIDAILEVADALAEGLSPIIKVVIEDIASVIRYAGKLISRISNYIRTVAKASKSASTFRAAIKKVSDTIIYFREKFIDVANAVSKTEGFSKLVNTVNSLVKALKVHVFSNASYYIEKIGKFFNTSFKLDDRFFDNLAESIGKAMGAVADFIDQTIRGEGPLFDFINQFKNSQPIQDFIGFIDKVKGKIEEFFETTDLGQSFKDFKDYIVETVKKVFSGDYSELNITEIATTVQSFFTKVFEKLKTLDWSTVLDTALSSIKDFFKQLIEKIKGYDFTGGEDTVFSKVINFFKKVANKFKEIDWMNVLSAGSKMLKVFALFEMIKRGSKVLKKLGATIGSLTSVITNISNLAKSAKNLVNASALFILVTSLIPLAGAMLMLSKVPSDKLAGIATVIVTVLAELIGGMLLLNKMAGNSVKFAAIGVAFAGLGAGLLMIAGATKAFGLLKDEDLIKTMLIIGNLMVMFKLATIGGGGTLGGAATFAAMALAIGILTPSLIALSSLDAERIIKGGSAIAGLLLSLSLAARIAGGGAKGGTALTILSMSVALGLLIPSLFVLSLIPVDKLLKGGLAVAALLTSLGFAAKLAGSGGNNAANLIALCFGIATATGALVILSTIEWDELLASAVSLSAVILSVAGAAKLANGAWSSIAIIGLVLAEVTGAFIALEHFDAEPSLEGAAGISAVLLSVAGAIRIVKGIKVKDGLAGLANIGMFLGGLTVVLVALGELKKIPGFDEVISGGGDVLDSIAKSLDSLTVLAIAAAAAGKFLGKIPFPMMLTALEDLGAFILGLGVVLTALGGLDKYSDGGFSELIDRGAESLSKFGTAIGEFAGSIVGGFLDKSVITFIEDLTNTLSNFGENIAPFMDSFSDGKAVETLESVAGVMVKFAEIKLANAWGGSTTSLATFMSDCSAALAGFGKDLSGVEIDGKHVASAKKLAEILEIFSNLNLPNTGEGSFWGWVTGEVDIGTYGAQLSSFMENFKPFVSNLQEMDDIKDLQSKCQSLADIISTFASIDVPKQKGFISLFTGGDNLGLFMQELSGMMPDYVEFAKRASAIPISEDLVSKVTGMASVITALAEVEPPKQTGFITVFIGQDNLSNFVKEMAAFMPDYAEFVRATFNIPQTDITPRVEAMANVISTFAALELPASKGSFISFFVGGNNLSNFGEQIKNFSVYFADYASQMESINMEGIMQRTGTMLNIIRAFAEVELPTSGKDLASKMFGGGLSKSFATGMSVLGEGFGVLVGYLADMDISKLTEFSTSVIPAYFDLANTVQTDFGNMSLESFGASLKEFGSKFKEYYDLISGIVMSKVTAAIDEVYKLIAVAKAMKEVDTGVVSAFGNALENLGHKGVDGFVKAFEDGEQKALTAMESILNTVRNEAEGNKQSLYNDFYSLGAYICDGLALGIASKANTVAEEAHSMVVRAKKRAYAGVDAQSPAKDMIKLGEYMDEGLVIGLQNKGEAVSEEAATVTTNVKDVMEVLINQLNEKSKEALMSGNADLVPAYALAIAKLKQSLSENIDAEPVITPVLDLSNVKRDANSISYLLSNKSIDYAAANSPVYGRINSVSLPNRVANQNGSVVEQIVMLRSDLNNLGDNMKRMQVVLDTGALVGGTQREYSKSFAMNAKRAR